MKKSIYVLLSFILLFIMVGCGNHTLVGSQENVPSQQEVQKEQETDMEQKTLVVYFSATKMTESLAKYAAEILNADLYEIVPKDPYTEADLAYYTNGRADQEQNNPAAHPTIFGGEENMAEYDTIVLGYPIWHGQAPRIISTFLKSYNFSGKTILPFCTSHSSGIGSSADNLHELCSDSVNWLDGKRFEAGTTKENVKAWLEGAMGK
ncbi:MAG: flavodoxin [Lachnospiraceae bacterium]|jgi:flavodoxin|nr:flavodoxin [Lachnospiraceae bacterium]